MGARKRGSEAGFPESDPDEVPTVIDAKPKKSAGKAKATKTATPAAGAAAKGDGGKRGAKK